MRLDFLRRRKKERESTAPPVAPVTPLASEATGAHVSYPLASGPQSKSASAPPPRGTRARLRSRRKKSPPRSPSPPVHRPSTSTVAASRPPVLVLAGSGSGSASGAGASQASLHSEDDPPFSEDGPPSSGAGTSIRQGQHRPPDLLRPTSGSSSRHRSARSVSPFDDSRSSRASIHMPRARNLCHSCSTHSSERAPTHQGQQTHPAHPFASTDSARCLPAPPARSQPCGATASDLYDTPAPRSQRLLPFPWTHTPASPTSGAKHLHSEQHEDGLTNSILPERSSSAMARPRSVTPTLPLEPASLASRDVSCRNHALLSSETDSRAPNTTLRPVNLTSATESGPSPDSHHASSIGPTSPLSLSSISFHDCIESRGRKTGTDLLTPPSLQHPLRSIDSTYPNAEDLRATESGARPKWATSGAGAGSGLCDPPGWNASRAPSVTTAQSSRTGARSSSPASSVTDFSEWTTATTTATTAATTTASEARDPPTRSSTPKPVSPAQGKGSSTDTKVPRPAGLVGLSNLGNTCFMSSALQCLAHTPAVVSYFISGDYNRETAPENPLGSKLELAHAFARLLDQIWNYTPSTTFVAPSPRKPTRSAAPPARPQAVTASALYAASLDPYSSRGIPRPIPNRLPPTTLTGTTRRRTVLPKKQNLRGSDDDLRLSPVANGNTTSKERSSTGDSSPKVQPPLETDHLGWVTRVPSLIPREFRAAVNKYAPQFSGYSQHDSHEFLAFILDGLHEDLNRAYQTKAPATSPLPVEQECADLSDPYGGKLPVLAGNNPFGAQAALTRQKAQDESLLQATSQAWAAWQSCNSSTISHLFTGLLRSTLICPACRFTTTRFDPFTYLSLPVPEPPEPQAPHTRPVVTLLPFDLSQAPVRVRLTPRADADMALICKQLASMLGISSPNLLVPAHVVENVVRRWYQPWERLTELAALERANDMVFFVLPPEAKTFKLLPTWTAPPLPVSAACSSSPSNPAGRCQRVDTYQSSLASLGISPPGKDEWAVVPVYTVRGRMHPGPGAELPIGGPTPEWDAPRMIVLSPAAARDPEAIALAASTAAGADRSPTKSKPILKIVARSLASPLPTTPPAPTKGSPDFFSALDSLPSGPSPAWPCVYTGTAIVAVWEDPMSAPSPTPPLRTGVLAAPPPGDATLSDCLDAFTAPEQLGPCDTWHCPGCETEQRAVKTLELWKLPDVLIVHLKRFRSPMPPSASIARSRSRSPGKSDRAEHPHGPPSEPRLRPTAAAPMAYATRTKRDEMIRYPLDKLALADQVGTRALTSRLDELTKAMSPSLAQGSSSAADSHNVKPDEQDVYDLYAVDCHQGSALGGHYTAMIRTGPRMDPLRKRGGDPLQSTAGDEDAWFVFDDSRIKPVAPAQVVNNQAYLLFYARRQPEHPMNASPHTAMSDTATKDE